MPLSEWLIAFWRAANWVWPYACHQLRSSGRVVGVRVARPVEPAVGAVDPEREEARDAVCRDAGLPAHRVPCRAIGLDHARGERRQDGLAGAEVLVEERERQGVRHVAERAVRHGEVDLGAQLGAPAGLARHGRRRLRRRRHGALDAERRAGAAVVALAPLADAPRDVGARDQPVAAGGGRLGEEHRVQAAPVSAIDGRYPLAGRRPCRRRRGGRPATGRTRSGRGPRASRRD